MKTIILLLNFVFLIACKSNKEVTIEQVYGIYEHTYTKHDNEIDKKWNGVKNIVMIKSDNIYEHMIYERDSLLIHEYGVYEFNRFIPCLDLKNYTEYVKYVNKSPEKTTNYVFFPKKNVFGKIYLSFNWAMDPDGAPVKPRYKKVK